MRLPRRRDDRTEALRACCIEPEVVDGAVAATDADSDSQAEILDRRDDRRDSPEEQEELLGCSSERRSPDAGRAWLCWWHSKQPVDWVAGTAAGYPEGTGLVVAVGYPENTGFVGLPENTG